ncbi:MAG: type IV toxin-antitoxin system AbiEi family antitoxin domain-containing protein [Deltaproteobacteria bacterium]|nr:type IV toxin-antitoxin system AbiEi family antitoxin domain-containing protein [Deltaproteobacteria bacterium]
MPIQPKIPTKLRRHLFTTQDALQDGLSKKDLMQLMQEGAITRLARGVYCPSAHDLSEEDQAILATLIVGRPSALCLLSALSYHHLTGIIPKKIWMMVPPEKRTQNIQLRSFRSTKPQWDIGIQKEKDYWVTDLERTLVDCLVQKRLIGPQTAIEALRQAIKEGTTTLDKVFKMAVRLKVDHRVIVYIEALA